MRFLLVAILSLWLVSGPVPGQPAPARVQITRGPYLQLATETSVQILWRTDRPATCRVEYGTDGYSRSAGSARAVTRHRVGLTGLQPGTRYRYRIRCGGQVLRQGVSFTTSKPAGKPFRFAVFGDSGSGEPGQQRLAARIAAANPDLILHTGDIVYPRGAEAGYDSRFFQPYRALLAQVVLWPVPGNHDRLSDRGGPYRSNFVLPRNGPAGVTPEHCYSFDYGDAHFVALDSNLSDGELAGRVVPWLRRDLAGTRRRWRFAFFHHPPYSAGLHGGSARVRRLLVPALSQGGVDVVFNGHDHTYERTHPVGGITYIVTGAGGAGLYRQKHPHQHTARFYNRAYSFTLVEVNGRHLRLRQIAADGTVVDQAAWQKPAASE